jgi:transposase
MDLTDAQWAILAPLLPTPRLRRDRRGRPWRDPRDVLNGILWILRTGAPWKDLPARYPSYQTCHRRFQTWIDRGTLRRVLKALAADLHARGGLDLTEAFIDGSFASATTKGCASATPNEAKGPRSWPSQTALVFLSPLPSPRPRRTKRASSPRR